MLRDQSAALLMTVTGLRRVRRVYKIRGRRFDVRIREPVAGGQRAARRRGLAFDQQLRSLAGE
jgi:hypothetical protein